MTMLFSRRLRGRVSGVTQIWWSTGIAALLALPWAFQIPLSTVARNLPYLVALGVVAQGIPYMLYFLGLERVQAQIVSIVAPARTGWRHPHRDAVLPGNPQRHRRRGHRL